MDKQLLVEHAIQKLSSYLGQQGIPVTDHRTMPAYYGYRAYPLRVGIVVPSLAGKSVSERIAVISPVARALFSSDEQVLIDTLLPFISSEEMNEHFEERIARVVAEHAWPD